MFHAIHYSRDMKVVFLNSDPKFVYEKVKFVFGDELLFCVTTSLKIHDVSTHQEEHTEELVT